jgi:3',5'-cyclic AMP phosphodiesterase CpdA
MSFFFVQLADPQFGMYADLSGFDNGRVAALANMGLKVAQVPETTGLAYETERYEKAIAAINRLSPAFVVTCGDMCNNKVDPTDELAELMRITASLDRGIPMHWVAGNHDVTNEPTATSLARYRERFGDDLYSFDQGGSHFVVLNSTVWQEPSNVREEFERQVEFLTSDLRVARDSGSKHIVVFTHHPLFLTHLDEGDGWLVIPRERRRVLVDLLKEYGAETVFAGHWHRNHVAYYGDLQVVCSGPVGLPLGDDPSGLRIVKVLDDRIEHRYYALDEVPVSVDLEE